MNTKITITKNGNYSPNRVFSFGNKYENVGDTLDFTIPSEYIGYHQYVVLYMKKMDPIVVPLMDRVDDAFRFYISSRITRNPGTYTFVYLCTENEIVEGDIDGARKVFVSNEMQGKVADNFLTDPLTEEELKDIYTEDGNLQIFYDKLLDLYGTLVDREATDYYKGDFYAPYWKDEGLNILAWRRYSRFVDETTDPPVSGWEVYEKNSEGVEEKVGTVETLGAIPSAMSLRGERGYTYKPQENLDVDGNIVWELLRDTSGEDIPVTNISNVVEKASTEYLDANLESLVDPKIEASVNEAVDSAIQFEWDDTNQILHITAVKFKEVESE